MSDKILAVTIEELVNKWLEAEHPEFPDGTYRMKVNRRTGVITVISEI